MHDIDLPNLKEKLWHKMRADLVRLIPDLANSELLLCPACCRQLAFDDFSIEHILPRQALAEDPVDVRQQVAHNQRAGITLLCRRQLIFRGKPLRGSGCNGWKGKHYDPYVREALRPDFTRRRVNSRHQIGLFSASFLGLFSKFGYQVALLPAGAAMRQQFFTPNKFFEGIPTSCQIMLTGQPHEKYEGENHSYWAEPFKFNVEDGAAVVTVRNFGLRLPLSRDPRTPYAQALRYAPPKYQLRPDFRSVFE